MPELTTEQLANRATWSAWLRMHADQQGRHRLSWAVPGSPGSPRRYCCLGAACELFSAGHWEGSAWVLESPTGSSVFAGSQLPLSVMDALGMDEGQRGRAVALNDIGVDDRGSWTFPQIADWIDAGMPV